MKTESKLNEKQGHWILARLGKKVLRPGGKELTEVLIKNLDINPQDDVVEFATGLGLTASLACKGKPKSFTGIDNNEVAAKLARKNVMYDKFNIIVADASETTLPNEYATKVYGEAMLTMQPIKHKKAIVSEAARILKSGGYYGIHELSITPDEVDEQIKEDIYKELSANIRVHARPLTTLEWSGLLEEQGFRIIKINHNPMHLLEPKRVLQDEGFFRTIKFVFNLMIQSDLRKRVLTMRKTFKKYHNHLNSIAIVAQKI